jgi:hypothetical protein
VDAPAEPSLLEMPLLSPASLNLPKSLIVIGAYLSLYNVVPVVVGAEATCDNVGLFRVEGYCSLNSLIKTLLVTKGTGILYLSISEAAWYSCRRMVRKVNWRRVLL